MLTNASLKYHYHPARGWMNDPNGLVYFDGYYHAFYQHAPHFEQPWHEAMVWGHARTKDFLNWEELPVALEADMPYDQNGAWSGTAIEKDGILWLFYASVDGEHRQKISVASSSDGIHFTKYAGNPVLDMPGARDFRDPAIFIRDGVNYLAIASSDPARKTGNVLLYRSDDFLSWEYVGILYEYENSHCCECPSFVHMGEKTLLAVSVQKTPEEHYFEVLVGDFDGNTFTPELRSHFQKGPDEYAGQVFNAPDGRPILISWVSGWHHSDHERCIGCLSLPLEIRADNGVITAYPVGEVRHLLQPDGTLTDAYVRETFVRGGEEVYIEILPEA